MSDADIKIKFDCNGFSSPAYSCSKPGDNSGVYVQSTDYDALIEQNKTLRDALNDVADLIDNSKGVSGLHRNGEIAGWGSLLEGGQFEEWLGSFSRALKE